MALAIDRAFIFSGGSHANAEDLVLQSEVLQPISAAEATPIESNADLAHRLRAYGAEAVILPEDLPDAFAAPEHWFSDAPESYVDSKGTPVATSFELTAVVNAADGGFAVIDGRPVKVGQTSRGLKLISIGNRAAVIEVGGVRHELSIATPTLDR